MRENQHRNGASAVLCRTSVCVLSHECTVGTIYSHVITINSAQVKTARSCRLHKIMPRAVGRHVADHAAVSRLRSSARGAPLHRSNFLVETHSFRETQLAGRVTLRIIRPAACAQHLPPHASPSLDPLPRGHLGPPSGLATAPNCDGCHTVAALANVLPNHAKGEGCLAARVPPRACEGVWRGGSLVVRRPSDPHRNLMIPLFSRRIRGLCSEIYRLVPSDHSGSLATKVPRRMCSLFRCRERGSPSHRD